MLWLAGPALAGPLADHPSPYLALHAGDPVNWRELDEAAMDTARAGDRLLFVSVGYYACHWCHVMQRESFQDPAIAEKLNRDFVPVKVDRELDPALDARLNAFAERLLGQSGWPLNVFVTPEGHPAFAVLYMPPDAFAAVVERMSRLWRTRSADVRAAAARTDAGPPRPARSVIDAVEVRALRKAFVDQALILHDDFQGGFGTVSKFPQSPALDYLLALARGAEAPRVLPLLELTLDAMARGGMYDHVGGGFFRYVVDPDFSTPHFEKMLYDNAQLAIVYAHAASVLPGRGYESVARDTLDFMQREMRSPHGAFFASLSAVDDADVEGGYYLYDDEELARLLDADQLRVVRAHCDITGAARLAAGHHLRCGRPLTFAARNMGITEAEARAVFETARAALLAERANRRLPADTKLLAGWNGLALSAYGRAAALFDDQAYAQTAAGIRDYLVNVLWRDGELVRAYAGGKILGRASIEDYALVARGLWDYAQATGSEADRELARAVVNAGFSRFRDGNGWRADQGGVLAPLPPVELVADSPLPSPVGMLAGLSLDIAASFDDPAMRRRAVETLNRAYDELAANAFFHATHIRSLNRLVGEG